MLKKKTVLTAIVLVLILSLSLAGCSTKKETTKEVEPSTSNTSATNEPVQSAEPTPLPEVKLTWYYPSGDPLGDEKQVYDKINAILKEKINATVDFRPVSWGEFPEKMKVMMAASEEFDITFTSNWLNDFQSAASKGNYVALDGLLANNAPKLFASMSENIWNATKLNGQIYAVPNQQIFARSSNMEINKKFADTYKLDYDAITRETFKLKDLEPFLESFKNGEKDKYPIELLWSQLTGYYGMELLGGDSATGAIMQSDTALKVFNQYESEPFKQHLALVKEWVDKGYFKAKEMLSKKDQLGKGANVGIWFGGTWKPGVEAEASAAAGTPMIERPISQSILTGSGILATLNAISRTSKNPERAMMVLELMNSDEELYNLLMWGIEGQNYKKLQGNYIETIVGNKYVGVPQWLLATTFRSYLINGQPEDVWEATKKVNEEAVASPLLGFAFDPTPVKTEYSNISAVVSEYLEGLTYGILSIDKDYPAFINKLKQAGSEKVIEEMQRQVDEWQKTK